MAVKLAVSYLCVRRSRVLTPPTAEPRPPGPSPPLIKKSCSLAWALAISI